MRVTFTVGVDSSFWCAISVRRKYSTITDAVEVGYELAFSMFKQRAVVAVVNSIDIGDSRYSEFPCDSGGIKSLLLANSSNKFQNIDSKVAMSKSSTLPNLLLVKAPYINN